MQYRRLLMPVLLMLMASTLLAQSLGEGLRQTYEVQYSLSDGHTPLWLNANRYGLSSLRSSNGYARASVERPLLTDSLKTWGIGYGADLAVPMGYTSSFVLQQCYAEARYRHAVLTLGQKQQPMRLHNKQLSSGAQTLGINARPVPGIRLEIPAYYDIPLTHRWLGIMGHASYGWMTDGDWQRDWTLQQSHYAEDVMLHTKAGYLRIGPDDTQHPYSLELGLEMACEFGGTMYHTNHGTVHGESGFKGWVNAFFAQGSDEADPVYHNVSGNHLGSWLGRLNYEWPAVRASVYFDHFFEDHSAMVFADFDGYGTGSQWNERVSNRYILYDLKDAQLGLELELKHCPWLRHLVVEFINTRYQSGPIYHDHNPALSDHIAGDDNYYNHYLYQGWSHWGQVMGNPLFRSPLYNTDHTLTVQDNRFYAWHFGASGVAGPLAYRMLLSWQQGYGTYPYPFIQPQRNLSMLAEATYTPCADGWLGNSAIRLAWGMDHGALLGNNVGLQLSLIYHIDSTLQR